MKIAIAGGGKLGLRIIEVLMGADHSITLIDKDEALLQRLSGSMDITTVAGNAKEVSLLKEVGIGTYDVFITTTDRDEKNIVIGATAKKLGVPKVIARIRDPEHMNQYEFLKETFHIDHIVNPDRSVAEEINKYLVEKYSIKGGVLHAGKVSLLEFGVDRMGHLIGLSVSKANEVLAAQDMRLVALSKNGKIIIPSHECMGDVLVDEYDEIYVVGDRDLIDKAAEKLVDEEEHTDLSRVMIAGGGKSGFYLARMLEEFGASVKIVEADKERCQYLSTHLHNVLILHGDATDIELLNDENFTEMDAFVSTTGFDEENLLLALLAKQAGIEDVIAKISRESFGELIEGMGVDMVLNPIDIEASHVMRFIKGAQILSSQIIQGQAEFIHIAIGRGMSLSGKPISQLKLPQGLTIIAVQRGTQVILPDAETHVEEGDRIVILSLLSESFDLEKLLKVKHGLFG
ncbi:MAG: Trk system potassium transporter TrkA [Clostridiales Family XIII bacterium]|jgi:trk system potassium uptake protein TrkA|nr:Trk system potassium transporter TrkA [Clostridiales Family XIII bacterium]